MEHIVDLETWPRAGQFHFFRTFAKPHYAVTARIDVTHLMAIRKARAISPYRASLYAIGAGLHAVPELCMRFRGDTVVRHEAVQLSMTVPKPDGGFNYAYVPFDLDFITFDTTAKRIIDATALATDLTPNDGADDVAFLSCMPWRDYTSLSNAMPGPDDCIPRVGWGKIVNHGDRSDMAMTLEVHHALADGAHAGAFFDAVQSALNTL